MAIIKDLKRMCDTYKGIPTIYFRNIHPELGEECYGESCVECWNREMEVNNDQN